MPHGGSDFTLLPSMCNQRFKIQTTIYWRFQTGVHAYVIEAVLHELSDLKAFARLPATELSEYFPFRRIGWQGVCSTPTLWVGFLDFVLALVIAKRAGAASWLHSRATWEFKRHG